MSRHNRAALIALEGHSAALDPRTQASLTRIQVALFSYRTLCRSAASMGLGNQNCVRSHKKEFRREQTARDYLTNWCFRVIFGLLIYFPGITSFNGCEVEYL
ncbi:hypothetical protein [Streptomyces sp. NPDC017993]|uniref:hypothetical protein n=1 Tax=Streptomyces sp. NPDC017993 TaxID=3365027 RepID=UPI00378E9B9B